MSYTIGEIAKLANLSRSTLIHYDKIGLLPASERGSNNYRYYSEADRDRLEKILAFRRTGMSLADIGQVINKANASTQTEALTLQLAQLDQDIAALRRQQQLTLKLLQQSDTYQQQRSMSKAQWVALLAAAGLDDDDMWQWHRAFEERMPEAHQDFLESLQNDSDEIREIRQRSRT
jgi:DNA-binding transcriptional MerR regulator